MARSSNVVVTLATTGASEALPARTATRGPGRPSPWAGVTVPPPVMFALFPVMSVPTSCHKAFYRATGKRRRPIPRILFVFFLVQGDEPFTDGVFGQLHGVVELQLLHDVGP